MTGRKTTAALVRTGDTITTPWSPQGLTLTVDYLTRDRFVNPEGRVVDRIRFTGTDNTGRHICEGWGTPAGEQVRVVREAPGAGDTFGALPEWVAPNWPVAPDAWLDDFEVEEGLL